MASMELNENEGQVLVNLLNIAVKTAGLDAAEAGLHFKRKIEEAFKPAQASEQNTEELPE